GGGNAKFDDEECVEVFEDGILISGCDDDDDDDGEGEGEFAGGAGGSLVRINAGGTLVMNAGAVLRNNIYSSGGGGVNIRNGGTFTMNNGEISGNTSTTSTGGGVVIQSGGTFTMHNGKISDNTSSGGGGVRVVGNATFTMNNGEISSNTSTSSGGGVSVAGTFIMANGKINGNTAVADGGGVRVSGTGSTFTMINGEISGNTAGANAGGVRAASNGTFTMQGGKITNNTGDTYGGGVNAGSSFFIMTGGEITDNTANTGGGGVRVSSGTVTIGGTSVVTNNVGGTTLATDNVLLANNQYINVGEPAEGMNVGITKAVTNNGGMFVQSGALPAHTQYFFDDTAVREITHHNGALFIGHHFYSQVATYTTAETNVIIEVEQDFTLDRLVSIPAPTTEGITLTIRSKDPDEPVTLTRGAGGNLFTIGSGRTLILENIIIDGGRTGSFADGSNGATLLRVNANGTLIMNSGTVLRNNITDYGAGVRIVGGTFTMNDGKINGNTATSTSSTGGGVRIESSGVFTMHGGEISGNSTGNGGGGVGVSSGTFTMNDGKISSNTGPNGGVRVSSGAIFTMNGGEVSGNTISSGATGVSLQSSTAIFNLNSGVVAGTGANTAAIVNGTYNLNLGEAPSPNNALIIAWNKPAGEGPFEYTRGTTTNLITLPTETATATWETQNNTLGIAYKNGNNEGFIEINGVTMKTHTITFDNGSSTEAEKQTIAAGDKATKPTDPTKEGFTFKGWYIGEEEFDFDAPITASITLTAKWAETTPIIANQVNPLIKRITVQTKSNAIILTNLPHNAKVEVYNLKGERVHSQFSILNSQLTIKVQTKGIYIVKIDTQTFRVPVK
ncbi:MAG: InlB B-repeat-containing protein, partial [Fibromonadaceae bacterium]|nr:InlB B-repeat-containing protein [Fibromonadaceae bacterium]